MHLDDNALKPSHYTSHASCIIDPTLHSRDKERVDSVSLSQVVSRMQKKVKRKDETLESNHPDHNLVEVNKDASEKKIRNSSLQTTETISAVKHEVHAPTSQSDQNSGFLADTDLGIDLQATDDAEAHSARKIKKNKRKDKASHDNKNCNADQKPLEGGGLCYLDIANDKLFEKNNSCSESFELESAINKNNQEEPLRSMTSESRHLSCDRPSTEIDMKPVEVLNLKTYHRKARRLHCSRGSSLETSRNEGINTSLQVLHNSSMDEASVNCGERALVQKKGTIKSRDVKDEAVVQRVASESGAYKEDKLQVSQNVSSSSKLKRVKVAGPVSSRVVKKSSMGDVLVTCSDSELAPRKIRRRTECTCEDNAIKEDLELKKAQKAECLPGLPAEKSKEEDAVNCNNKETSSLFGMAGASSHTLELPNKQGESSDLCEEPTEDNIILHKSSSNSLSKRSGSKMRKRKMKDMLAGKSSDDISSCEPSTEQLKRHKVNSAFGEGIGKVDASPVSGWNDKIVSSSDCEKEEVPFTPLGKDAGENDITTREDIPSKILSKEASSHSSCLPKTYLRKRSRFSEENKQPTVQEDRDSDDLSICLSGAPVIRNELLENSAVSPKRSPVSDSKKKLLILDINGLLADIVSYVPCGYKVDKRISKKGLFKRPHCDDFLRFCFERFNVGVWSSRLERNVNVAIDFLMGEMKDKLLFSWNQSHCTDTGYSTVENSSKPLVLKELKKLWDKEDPALPWKKGEYNESNTLLLDDSPYKALRNPPHTAVFPKSYSFEDKEDNSLGPGGDIRVYLEKLAAAENVQEYIEQHPFGQRAITSNNASWSYYLKIVGTDNFISLS